MAFFTDCFRQVTDRLTETGQRQGVNHQNGRYSDRNQESSEMIVGHASTFAIESEIGSAYEEPGLLALGFFVIHILGRRYGVKEPDATMLSNSFTEVCRRLAERGLHNAPFAAGTEAAQVAVAFRRAVYTECDEGELFFGMALSEFTEALYSNRLVWAPDGDEAFDDGSYVLQFDIGDRVRLIAFNSTSDEDPLWDPTSLREVWLAADQFYGVLHEWRDKFRLEWESLPKASGCD
jgi:hypothetical protein